MSNNLLNKYFPDTRTATNRLAGNVLLHEGQLIKMLGEAWVGDDNEIYMYAEYLESPQRKKQVAIDVNLLNNSIQELPLGYANTRQGCIFLKRVVNRNSRMGLYSSGISCSGYFPTEFMYTKDFVACLRNVYPSYEEAINKCTNSISIAFHKYLAVARIDKSECALYYNGDHTGYIKSSNLGQIECPSVTYQKLSNSRLFNKLLPSVGLSIIERST
jgi:hypothetical protein